MKGIFAEHRHCVFGWRFFEGDATVPGKNKAKNITRFDSLDHDRLDFLGLERL